MVLFALSLSADIQHGNSRHLCKFTGAGSCGHGNKRIITTAAGHSIELVLPPLETLFKFYAARFRAMYVGTAGPGVAFYARFGFTHSHTVTGFFTDNYPEPLYEDGVLLTDMLYLKKELA